MENQIILNGLTRKRAELSGDLTQAESLMSRLQADIESLDRAILIFDPSATPSSIRPRVKRKPDSSFCPGQFTRDLIGVLRVAGKPMTARDLASALVSKRGLALDPGGLERLVHKARNALARTREGIVGERAERGRVYWRVT